MFFSRERVSSYVIVCNTHLNLLRGAFHRPLEKQNVATSLSPPKSIDYHASINDKHCEHTPIYGIGGRTYFMGGVDMALATRI